METFPGVASPQTILRLLLLRILDSVFVLLCGRITGLVRPSVRVSVPYICRECYVCSKKLLHCKRASLLPHRTLDCDVIMVIRARPNKPHYWSSSSVCLSVCRPGMDTFQEVASLAASPRLPAQSVLPVCVMSMIAPGQLQECQRCQL